ncbi:hypothetical protein [Niallia taxi]|uniref:hypothetical protein n=1 Tax=Niallia taxi TaxID=2499688 RepID=UPI002550F3E8|nr:hypothetical protein [Niallia taxi]MDK8641343.1 hypothetical protein [Niallia taxi]
MGVEFQSIIFCKEVIVTEDQGYSKYTANDVLYQYRIDANSVENVAVNIIISIINLRSNINYRFNIRVSDSNGMSWGGIGHTISKSTSGETGHITQTIIKSGMAFSRDYFKVNTSLDFYLSIESEEGYFYEKDFSKVTLPIIAPIKDEKVNE